MFDYVVIILHARKQLGFSRKGTPKNVQNVSLIYGITHVHTAWITGLEQAGTLSAGNKDLVLLIIAECAKS